MVKSDTLVLFDIDDVLFNTDHFIKSELTDFALYEDVLTTLDEVAKSAEIGILSQGELELQTKKLIETGIHDRFTKDHIHIVAKKDESLRHVLNKYIGHTSIFFIDDRLQGLYHAKNSLHMIKTIWLKRGRYANAHEGIEAFSPDYIISDFSEIIKIVN